MRLLIAYAVYALAVVVQRASNAAMAVAGWGKPSPQHYIYPDSGSGWTDME